MPATIEGLGGTARDAAIIGGEIALYQSATGFALEQTSLPYYWRSVIQFSAAAGLGLLIGAFTAPATMGRTAAIGLASAGLVAGVYTAVQGLANVYMASRVRRDMMADAQEAIRANTPAASNPATNPAGALPAGNRRTSNVEMRRRQYARV